MIRWLGSLAVFVSLGVAAGAAAYAYQAHRSVTELERANAQQAAEIRAMAGAAAALRGRIEDLESQVGFGIGFRSIENRLDDLEFDVSSLDRRLTFCMSAVSRAINNVYLRTVIC